MRRYTRRHFIRIVAATASASALARMTVPTPRAVMAQTTQVVRLLSHAGGSEPGLRAMARQFAAAKDGRVEIEITAIPLDQLYTRAAVEFLAKSDTFDVLTLNDQWAGAWAPHLVPLEELPGYSARDIEHIIPSLMAMGEANGVRYGLPHRVGANILFYRTDLLRQKGIKVPVTQDEYLATAKALTGDGIYGASITAKHPLWSTLDFLTLLWARGAREIDVKFETPLLDRPPSIETAEFYTDLFRKHHVVPPDVLSYTFEQQITAMQQGIVAMIIDYSARVGSVEDPTASKIVGRVGYALVPLGKGVTRKLGTDYMAGHCLVVSKYSKRRVLAYEFAKFATTPRAQLEMAVNYRNGPTTTETYTDPDFRKVIPPAGVILRALRTARARPSVPQWNDMDIALGEELTNIFIGRKTPPAAMRDANRKWQQLLRR